MGADGGRLAGGCGAGFLPASLGRKQEDQSAMETTTVIIRWVRYSIGNGPESPFDEKQPTVGRYRKSSILCRREVRFSSHDSQHLQQIAIV